MKRGMEEMEIREVRRDDGSGTDDILQPCTVVVQYGVAVTFVGV